MDRVRRPCFAGLFAVVAASLCFPQTVAVSGNSEKIVTPPVSVLTEARLLYGKGDFNAAIEKYKEVLKENPHSPDAIAGQVRSYLKLKNVEQAEQVADSGLTVINHPRIRTARAEVWFRQGKMIEAEKELVDIINSGYPDAHAYLALARQREAIAMYKSSRALIAKAHNLDPDDPDIRDEWVGTLSRAERIKYLESSLAGNNDWDAERREDEANYLKYLQERAKQKNTSPCRLVSHATATETPMVRLLEDPQHLRGLGLAVLLNGRKSSLMIDTGASGILVSRSVAEHSGITKISETKVGGIGKKGRRNAFVGVADSIKVGQLEFQNCPIKIMEKGSVVGDEGLIGTDVFEDFLVELDFPNQKMRLSQLPRRPGEAETTLTLRNEDGDSEDDSGEPAPETKSQDGKPAAAASSAAGPQDRYIAPEMQPYTRVYRFGHDLLVPTSIGGAASKLFLLDTGSFVNFISPAAAREVTKVHGNSDVIVEGISGKVDKVYSAKKAVLAFGHLRQENQDMTAFDTTPISDDVGTEVSGFLGFTTLIMLDIKIDYRDALVDFEYDAKRFGR